MYRLQEWLQLDDREIAAIIGQRVSTAAVYLNGTRRWFLSRGQDWADYSRLTGSAQRELSQLLYSHGLRTLVQPLLGYDLFSRGQDYLKMAVEQGLGQLATQDYRRWYRQSGIRVTFYGNWLATLIEHGFTQVADSFVEILDETRHHDRYNLLLGVFADEGLDRIVTLAKNAATGDELLRKYYGQPVGPIDLIIGSGQPVIWDLPLLDINKANMYFLQAPTFCLDRTTIRQILYDHIYQRVNDDELYDNLNREEWQRFTVLGLGQQTWKGWTAI